MENIITGMPEEAISLQLSDGYKARGGFGDAKVCHKSH